MNKLQGKIVAVQTIDQFSKVRLEVGAAVFASIVIAASDINPSLAIGNRVQLLFKETDVTLCIAMPPLISIANKIPVVIESIEFGIILSRIIVRFNQLKINTVVPTDFAKQVAIGKQAVMLIRSNEIMLMD